MPLTLTWHEIALRLALSVVAGGLIGLDRGEHGRPAGLRTTLLVCLAAAVAMIQTNLLLVTIGKTADSFLTGMGFIGGGAILRRESLVLGVTTAATLWFVTVIGLCFGGGQISLGITAFVLGMMVLSGLRWFDYRMKQEQHGTLTLTTERDQPSEEEIQATVRKAGYKISLSAVAYGGETEQRQLEFNLQWRGVPQHADAPPFVRQLLKEQHVLAARFRVS
jgi:putative Mg2+ transporter-C (MgtC) family protein